MGSLVPGNLCLRCGELLCFDQRICHGEQDDQSKKYNRLMVPDPVLFAVVYIAVFCVFSGKQKCENLGRRGDAGTGKAMVVYICIFCAVFSDPVFKCSDPQHFSANIQKSFAVDPACNMLPGLRPSDRCVLSE